MAAMLSQWYYSPVPGVPHVFFISSFVDSLFGAVLIQEIDNDCWCLVLPVVVVLLHIFHDQNST
jgi:hypothetical protein